MKTTIMSTLLLTVCAVSQAGLQPMDEAEMSATHGAGIAVALDDFAYLMAPTSYLEQVGTTPANACTGSGTVASNLDCWRRGDLRWYGSNLSSAANVAGAGLHWDDTTTCNPGAGAMNCPRGGQIADFSPFDNPYLMRAWSPEGMDYQGAPVNDNPNSPTKTIYEYLAPTSQPDYLLSFWGEIEAGATRDPSTQALTVGTGLANGGGLLKSQTIIRGNAAGSIFRMFRFTETGASPRYGETFAMLYHSYLQGDFRFSVAQHDDDNNPNTPSPFATDVIGQAPRFGNDEGLHFRNVDAFLPLGQLYYQALVLNAVGTSGNFSLELTQIPNNATVYSRYYGLNDGDDLGYETARLALANLGQPCAANDQNCLNYRSSHGHIRYGDWYPGASAGRNSIGDTDDGIFFRACVDCAPFNAYAARSLVIDKRGPTYSRQRTQNYNCDTGNAGNCTVNTVNGGPVIAQSIGDYTRTFPTKNVNLGDARMEGLLINRFELISCQAGGC